ncbi:hypothetical protein A0O28_0007560 [Trichoderma guizhouense]|uniref:Uncharacterized protein n=1 Tax=Trichoderma guizhouense TaxID=1491466 RepID=A0A1T3CHT9_9HYPO|nr:hypothetical protein A0O28_0007560 [Trichoderma guizhouense]
MPSAAPEPELEPRSCDDLHLHASWDGSAVDLDLYEYSFASTIPQRDSDMDMAGYDWLEQPGFALDDGSTFEMGRFDLAPWSHLPPPTAEARRPPDDMAAINNTLASHINRSSNAATATTGQRLTALVSEIQQQLRRLEEGPWHTDSTHSLHDYPVGTILELSQQFSAIAGSILSSTVCTSGGLEEAGSDEDNDNSGRTAGCATADTPTMLLIMCGYIWLVRIYGIVMGHFHKHLDRMPTGDPRHLIRTTAGVISPITSGVSTKLRLGELPCTDVALSLQQIHTAVRMLLDVLHEIEGHLGRGAVAACDMAVALLLNSGRPQNGSSRGLGIKAAAVKKLLREKMGL